jgi:arylsulfatase A-like enzyme
LLGLLIAPGIATGLYLIASVHPWDLPKQERLYAVNPVVELVTTAFASGTSDLLRQRDAVPPEQLPPQVNDMRDLPPKLAGAPIRNVVIVVLESVGAKYFGPTAVTAHQSALSKYAPVTLSFTNAYAQAAHSTKSLFSLITGRPPLFSFAQDTEALKKGRFVTLPERLKSHGYRTAFFVNDLRYAHAGDFLRGRGFDLLGDGTSLNCPSDVENSCLIESALGWMANGGQPFLAVVWTHDTHFPYWPKREPKPGEFSPNPDQNRYIAAVRESEDSVAGMLDWLQRRGLLSTTLVVVLGDHGEAFGEHGYNLHSNTIYEEELHIPMLLISASAKGRSFNTLVSISDVPQTILHVLKLGPELSWDSRSFFEPAHAKRLFLFAPQGPAIGFREGDKKYVLDLSTGESLMFDLGRDPGEKINLANAQTADYVRTRAAGWLQYQDRRLGSALDAGSR